MDIHIPGYTPLRTLGKGGMATVYLARQDLLERNVALKVMSGNLAEDPTFGARFMREAKIVSQLVHPNIVTVHEVGQHDGHYFLSMEYIDGHDLRTVRKKLDFSGKIRVIEDMARALHYAGEKGYVHRDIKPENIMFRANDGSAVLTDFGIAKAVKTDLSMTQTGTAIGTPHYMSPEQAKGKEVDQRSDLYSLGVVLFLMLSGRVPYDAETAIAIGIKHLSEPVPKLPSPYDEVQPILDGLMAKDPSGRYQSGLQLLNDLRSLDIERIQADLDALEDAPTIASELPQKLSEKLSDSNDSTRFTLALEAVQTVERPPRSVFPGVIAAVFIICAIAFFVYMARPKILEPQIVQVESLLDQVSSSLGSSVDEGVNVAGGALEELKSEYLEEKGGTSASTEISDPVQEPQASPNQNDIESSSVQNVASGSIQRDIDEAVQDLPELASVIDTDTQVISDVPLPSLEVFRAELQTAKRSLGKSTESQKAYVDAHKRLLNAYPNHAEALASLRQFKQQKQASMLLFAQKGDAETVDRKLLEYESFFAEDSELIAFKSQLKNELEVQALIAKAKQEIGQGHYFNPEPANAVMTLKKALSIQGNNTEAKSLLLDIASSVNGRAESAFSSGDLETAFGLSQLALNAYPDSQAVQQLASRISEQRQYQQGLNLALSKAQEYIGQGHLYLPIGNCAYDAYLRALELDPNNVAALEGKKALIDKLSVKVWSLVGEAKFDQARALLSRPQALMPGNERIEAMRVAIDDVAGGQNN